MFTKTLYHMALLAAVAALPLERLQRTPDSGNIEVSAILHISSSLHLQATSVPVTIYVPGDDPKQDEHANKIRQAWTDATMLAAFIHASIWDDEPIFKRYFEKENTHFVKDILDAVAQFENPDGLDGTDPSKLEDIMKNDIKTNPKSTELTLSYNDRPDIPQVDRACGKMPAAFVGFAYTYLAFDKANKNRAIVVLCDMAFRFPSLDNIEKDVEATWEQGPGCKDMGSFGCGWMTALGGLLLHEFNHRHYLLKDVPTSEDIVRLTPKDIIDDYDEWDDAFPNKVWPIPPRSGYGPFNAMTLNDNVDSIPHMAILNADNYRWYAQSKWWSLTCKKEAQEPKDDGGKTGDKMRSSLTAQSLSWTLEGFDALSLTHGDHI